MSTDSTESPVSAPVETQLSPDIVSRDTSGSTGVAADFRTPVQEKALVLLLMDLVCSVAAILLAFITLRIQNQDLGWTNIANDKWHWAPQAIAIWLISAVVTELYDVKSSGARRLTVQRIMFAMILSAMISLGAYYVFSDYFPRQFLLLFIGYCGVLTAFCRCSAIGRDRKHSVQHRLVLVGGESAETELNDLFSRVSGLNLRVVARIDEPQLAKMHFQSNGEGLLDYVRQQQIHEVVVSHDVDSDEIFRELVQCQSHGFRISSMTELYRLLAKKIPVRHVNAAWVIRLLQDRLLFTRLQLTIKRAFDLLGALIALPVFLAIFPFVALAIKLSSDGPIFYRQTRSGRGGQPFQIIKFRTMRTDAEQAGPQWSQQNDPRVTRIGRFMRQTRIDELPQVLNVLAGDMSLVGPRPERPEFDVKLDMEIPHYFIRRLVKPGITGWAQVHYKYGNTVEDSLVKLEYDAYYVRYWSLILDLYTICRTIAVVIGSKGH